jgi:hypothetical protein
MKVRSFILVNLSESVRERDPRMAAIHHLTVEQLDGMQSLLMAAYRPRPRGARP